MDNLLPPGTYLAKLTGHGLTEPKAGKVPQIALTFNLVEQNRVITWFGSLSTDALPYTVKALTVAGMQGDDLTVLADVTRVPFEDKEVNLVVEHETYEGTTRVKVKWINEVGGANFKKLDPTTALGVLSGLNDQVKAIKMSQGNGASEGAFDPGL